eukprot:GHVL01014510.1.p1 GENE.GHVL01014510.1~~GHVL01014510.1.p1  ORF type:complete len:328 (+),score=10.48 GHVL01014510.1:113-1096(+)
MTFIFFVLALGLASARDLDTEWELYKEKFNKVYRETHEEQFRRSVWEHHLQYIDNHNMEAKRGEHSFVLAVNRFADTPNKEFQKLMTGFRMRNESRTGGAKFSFPRDNLRDLPDTVDWRPEGYVTPVKDQAQCGACWAFSTTGSLEGQWFKKTGQLVSLSEQNLVDCAKNGNIGCEGGLMELAFMYIGANDGVDTEESYPYEARDGECRFQRDQVGASVTGFVEIEAFSEIDQQAAVATVGPVSVAMDASRLSFQFYSSGVYYDADCSSGLLNHAVLAVGYGAQDGQDYWIMKNSWGTQWGDKGYFLMARNRDNNCGIATDSSFPTV